eukprot:CAMPEP_0180698122 /NCGR_PEP_ID=MMETSP1038_2-20121128/3857_1 /TAXON_ID=632150 /ORGANISM="Azadinium spinosum, Strain 3D9" /LENGTH=369 /DNA_ID=CAMNT_0022729673 /DNA_START=26 /DNA_END=1130 /DNA_ORIENTATION=+
MASSPKASVQPDVEVSPVKIKRTEAEMPPSKVRKTEGDVKTTEDAKAAPKLPSSYEAHHSWTDAPASFDFVELERLQKLQPRSTLASGYQHGLIPVYDAQSLDFCGDQTAQRDLHTSFFDHAGCVIIKGVFSQECMAGYTSWSEDMLEKSKNDPQSRHPKQAGKRLINDVFGRMSATDPDLLFELVGNPTLNALMDTLLGFGRFGALTTHWIEAGGERQLSHVDYPLHVGSGKFWEASVAKMKRLTTREQANHIMSRFSVQILIASDAMDVSNGSTEVVPCSHLLQDLAAHIHNPAIYAEFEHRFVNVTLEKGDILIFNRGLCHRGGWNKSAKRRNSLIAAMRVGQEIIESARIIERLEKGSPRYQALS